LFQRRNATGTKGGSPVTLLEVTGLTTELSQPNRTVRAVDDISFSLEPGETVGLVGESGSGKTMTGLAIMGMLPPAARIEDGSIMLGGQDLLTLNARELRAVRGKRMAMVMQDPMTALDPSFTIKSQVKAPLRRHQGLGGASLEESIIAAFRRVPLPVTPGRLEQFPHQLSGGMRQRVVSAIALTGEPEMLIADEPTSALDVTTQARYLSLLRDLQERSGFGLLLIAHDLMLVRHVCAEVIVMYGGRVVESGPSSALFETPTHPYTRALLKSVPGIGHEAEFEPIEGQAPDLGDDGPACAFAPRCRYAREICADRVPQLRPRPAEGHEARCWGTEPDGWIET
jgi:oligopeptide/dipeptide ABC transporter ATP-binding protein